MRWILALVSLPLLGGCDAMSYCGMVHSDTCVSSPATLGGYEPYVPAPYVSPPVVETETDGHSTTSVAGSGSVETIVNINGDNNVVNVNHYAAAKVSYEPVKEPAVLPQRLPFDDDVARSALHDVDLAACRVDGAGGPGHARVTFTSEGDVSAVVIDSPRGLGPHAVECIGSRLGKAHVPAFSGGAITRGVVYVVP